MNAPALAQDLDAAVLTPPAAKRRGGSTRASAPVTMPAATEVPDLQAIAAVQDDELRCEQALAAMRHACRASDVELLAHAAALAMPTTDPEPVRLSLYGHLAQCRSVPLQAPDENRLFLLRRANGSPIGLLRLRAGGRIHGQASAGAELPTQWQVRDGSIELHMADGRLCSRLGLHAVAWGLRQHLGEATQDGGLHVLSEVRCPYSRLRMLDAELVGPFGAMFGTDAMVPVPMPERPLVLIAQPHTGAQRLLRLLNSSADVLVDGELMHPHTIGLHGQDLRQDHAGALYGVRAKDPVYFARLMLARSHHADGRVLHEVPVRGLTLNPAHGQAVLDWAIDEPGVTVLHLVRDNLLAEYASTLTAAGEAPRRGLLHFDAERFGRFVQMKQRYLQQMQQRLDARTGAWAEIETSAFTRQNVVQLLDFVLEGAGSRASLPAAALARQRPERTLERFANPNDVRRALAEVGREDWAT
ncbi:MAG: hypothetical protein RLY78_663 [Pseudomonadota bacterium]|jgi:hypothetical protein|uniref:Uncharacterized protein n=1 Tax=Pseudaquabacterium rugosum TaxID=2984194 RepID=A0ABU9B5T2_9BURK